MSTTSPTVGIYNVNGSRAMHFYGIQNVFAGQLSGNTTLTGSFSAGFGYEALKALTSGNYSTGLGFNAGKSITTANHSTFVGNGAGQNLVSGNANTVVGSAALANLTTGGSNICIGYLSGSNYTGAESNNILIGDTGTLAENQVLRVGGALQTTCYVGGIKNTAQDFDNTHRLVAVDTTSGQLSHSKCPHAFTGSAIGAPLLLAANYECDVQGSGNFGFLNNWYQTMLPYNYDVTSLTLSAYTTAAGNLVAQLRKGVALVGAVATLVCAANAWQSITVPQTISYIGGVDTISLTIVPDLTTMANIDTIQWTIDGLRY
jgi:hypothetical protein